MPGPNKAAVDTELKFPAWPGTKEEADKELVSLFESMISAYAGELFQDSIYLRSRSADTWENLASGALPQEDAIIYSVYEDNARAEAKVEVKTQLERLIANVQNFKHEHPFFLNEYDYEEMSFYYFSGESGVYYIKEFDSIVRLRRLGEHHVFSLEDVGWVVVTVYEIELGENNSRIGVVPKKLKLVKLGPL